MAESDRCVCVGMSDDDWEDVLTVLQSAGLTALEEDDRDLVEAIQRLGRQIKQQRDQ